MSLDAATYFQHLKAYINSKYVVHDGQGGHVVLRENIFQRERRELVRVGLLSAFPAWGLRSSWISIRWNSSERNLSRHYFTF